MPRNLLSLDAAADQLGISTKSVRRYIAAGTLSAVRVGPRLLRVEADSLDQLLKPVPRCA